MRAVWEEREDERDEERPSRKWGHGSSALTWPRSSLRQPRSHAAPSSEPRQPAPVRPRPRPGSRQHLVLPRPRPRPSPSARAPEHHESLKSVSQVPTVTSAAVVQIRCVVSLHSLLLSPELTSLISTASVSTSSSAQARPASQHGHLMRSSGGPVAGTVRARRPGRRRTPRRPSPPRDSLAASATPTVRPARLSNLHPLGAREPATGDQPADASSPPPLPLLALLTFLSSYRSSRTLGSKGRRIK